jgi:hypothetical protein
VCYVYSTIATKLALDFDRENQLEVAAPAWVNSTREWGCESDHNPPGRAAKGERRSTPLVGDDAEFRLAIVRKNELDSQMFVVAADSLTGLFQQLRRQGVTLPNRQPRD